MTARANMTEQYTIGTLAQRIGVNVETIRYYQRRRLVQKPSRPLGGVRHYAEAHARRLRFIRAAQKLGFSLDEVGELLSLKDGLCCCKVEQIARHKLAVVRKRMAQLGEIEDMLVLLVGKCRGNGDKLQCPLVASLEDATG